MQKCSSAGSNQRIPQLLRECEPQQPGGVISTCRICCDPLDGKVLECRLTCQHRFHFACLGQHVLTKCNEANNAVENELRAFMSPGLDIADLRRQHKVRQCPKCGYGPVVNQHCDDMATHDSSRGTHHEHVNNSCGKCGFFSESFAHWAEWDPSKPCRAALCPLCKSSCKLDRESLSLALATFEKAHEYLERLPQSLSQSLECGADLVALVLLLQPEAWDQKAGLERILALALDPEGMEKLLGRMKDLLQKRLTKELEVQRELESLARGAASSGQALFAKSAALGSRVRRGPAWKHGAADDYGLGTVVRVMASQFSDTLVDVEWDAGHTGIYRAPSSGMSGAELALHDEGSPHLPWAESAGATSDMDREILNAIFHPSSQCLPAAQMQNAVTQLCAKIAEHQRTKSYAALFLSCMEEQLEGSLVRSLGRPWLPIADGVVDAFNTHLSLLDLLTDSVEIKNAGGKKRVLLVWNSLRKDTSTVSRRIQDALCGPNNHSPQTGMNLPRGPLARADAAGVVDRPSMQPWSQEMVAASLTAARIYLGSADSDPRGDIRRLEDMLQALRTLHTGGHPFSSAFGQESTESFLVVVLRQLSSPGSTLTPLLPLLQHNS
eukprot:TRINITY_DN33401_c0_g1_i1.p1 TRINITY_DN33401_c0_g1~~TRINITY_DN33401_c0_g1_i1.p1  ORF type:complete len:645 (+),score=89.02 TRINITY_DN33401_c0_g1_i1:107-1936(+)